MTLGQKITVVKGKRRFGESANQGTIISIDRRSIVVQYKNYKESFLKVEVENNIERRFELG